MGQPQKREWTVDLRARDPETGERFWDEDYAQQQTIEAYLECASIQHREGGGFVIGPLRRQVPAAPDALSDGPVWANLGLVIQHTFMPPVQQRVESRVVQATDTNGTHNGGHPFAPDLGAEEEMRDEDERAVAAELEEGEGFPRNGVFPQAPDPVGEPPYADEDAELSRLRPDDLLPKVQ